MNLSNKSAKNNKLVVDNSKKQTILTFSVLITGLMALSF